ncbi:hypothetical protein AB1Y20_017798 [Prymnesium parvum]|uniref:CS domain-containing protein n=1 Tax=Prymnesium parvum TaxID=97485 RepID=A0AB34JMM3_PRYPA
MCCRPAPQSRVVSEAVRSMRCRLRVCVCVLVAAVAAGGSFLDSTATQHEALELLASGSHRPTESDVLVAVERAWWEASKLMLRKMREDGAVVGTMQEVRSAATKMRDQATDIINLMRVGANAEETVVNAAFQWAQRLEYVYLNVKFSSRIDGPVTCLNVDNENITFTNDSLYFEGIGRQKPKTFKLNLTFHQEIDPEASSWSFSSVGRMSITIAKKEHGTWPRLLKTKQKPKNMYSWYDRQTALDEEVKKEKEAKKKDEEEKKKQDAAEEAKRKQKEAPKDPPAPYPADGAPQPVPSAASNAKSSSKKKRVKKESAKDEV